MKRREFIEIAATGAAGVALVVPTVARGSDGMAALAHPHLLEVLRDPKLVLALGRRYRELTPSEQTNGALAHAISADLNAPAPFATNECLERQLAERVQRDFAMGRTVTLNGWVLALTEARQCALYSLHFS
jgi:hypothetical protein